MTGLWLLSIFSVEIPVFGVRWGTGLPPLHEVGRGQFSDESSGCSYWGSWGQSDGTLLGIDVIIPVLQTTRQRFKKFQ